MLCLRLQSWDQNTGCLTPASFPLGPCFPKHNIPIDIDCHLIAVLQICTYWYLDSKGVRVAVLYHT